MPIFSSPAEAPVLSHRGEPVNASARAWLRVVNRYSIATVFYLCLALVLSDYVIGWHRMAPDVWLNEVVFYMRQTLVSGLSMLFAIGLAEVVLEGRSVSPPTAKVTATAVRALAVAAAAAIGPLVRIELAGGQNMHARFFIVFTFLIWLLIGGMGTALLRITADNARARERLDQARREGEALNTRKLEAQLLALQAQIEPHFLFNTLANVKRLYETEPGRGRDMLISLIDYLHAALPSMRQSGSTLRRELELARSFLTILQLRMGERLRFDIRTDDDALLDAAMPPMVIATLVENAIKHGIAPRPEGGSIAISARRTADGRLQVEVEDDGTGFVAAGGSGVGLANTRSRLAALFGDRAALELASGAVRGVIARVVLPLRPVAGVTAGLVSGAAVSAAA